MNKKQEFASTRKRNQRGESLERCAKIGSFFVLNIFTGHTPKSMNAKRKKCFMKSVLYVKFINLECRVRFFVRRDTDQRKKGLYFCNFFSRSAKRRVHRNMYMGLKSYCPFLK